MGHRDKGARGSPASSCVGGVATKCESPDIPHQRYTCTALAASYSAATCLHVDGACLEAVVIEAFFQALALAELNLLEEVLAAQRADVVRLEKLRADQLARAEYEATLAQRSYQAVDPANRLVAAELERRWEIALQAVAEAREEKERMVSQPQVASTRTIFGLAQELGVHRNWLYTRIHQGMLPATRHNVTGHYLIADEPEILATFRAQRDRCCYH